MGDFKMTDNIFKRMGSTISAKLDAIKAELQANIDALVKTDNNYTTAEKNKLANIDTTNYVQTSMLGGNNGVATLDGTGKIPAGQLPALAITDTYVVGSQAAMLALSTANTGDVAVRTDITKCFILKGTSYSTLSDWQELLTPTQTVTVPYDVVFSVYGTQTDANEQLLRFLSPRAFTIPANFSGSIAKAEVAATSQTVFTVKKNGASIGTITFAASGTTGTFSSTAQISVVSGDVLTAVGAATADATLANIDIVISASVV